MVANLDKIFACAKSPSFTQTIPVDIKSLIHRWGLDRRLRSGKLSSSDCAPRRLQRAGAGWRDGASSRRPTMRGLLMRRAIVGARDVSG